MKDIAASDLVVLSRLLDEALDAPDREAWLLRLPVEHAHLSEALRRMMASESDPLTSSPLNSLPVLDDVEPAREGDRVGPYRIEREIGRGGMGQVWLAERVDGAGLKRRVALKLPRLSWGPGLADRMAIERDIGALLEHPHIARLYDGGVDAHGQPYLAFEYIEGQPIDAWCKQKSLSIPDRLRLFLQVMEAVAYAHSRLIVHRDLKPSNVLVAADGQARLLDFGVAKLLQEAGAADDVAHLTREYGRVLTPHYASPEQILGETVTIATDVYSLGVVLYELLAGRRPHVAKRTSAAAMEEAILEGQPAAASSRAEDKHTARALRGELDAILAKALHRQPAQRHATVDAFAQDIQRHLAGDRVLARPDSAAYRIATLVRRYRTAFAGLGVVMVAVIAGTTVSLVQARRANEAAERARVVKEFVVDVFRVNERSSPANAQARQLPATVLLERGARLIESKFKGQPELQAELFGVVSSIFVDSGNPVQAEAYARKQIALLTQLKAESSARSQALTLLSLALRAQSLDMEAEVAARQAIALANGDPDVEIDARLALLYAIVYAPVPNVLREVSTLEALLTRYPKRHEVARTEVVYMRGVLVGRGGDYNAAIRDIRRAIEMALSAEGPLSKRVVRYRRMYAAHLADMGDMDAVRQYELADKAMQEISSPEDVDAASIRLENLEKLYGAGLISGEQATREGEAKLAILRHSPELINPDRLAYRELILGAIYIQWGDVKRGLALMDGALPELKAGRRRRDIVLYLFGVREEVVGDINKAHATYLELASEGSKAYSSPWYRADHGLILNRIHAGRFEEAEALINVRDAAVATSDRSHYAAPEYFLYTASYRALKDLESGHPNRVLNRISTADVTAAAKFREFPSLAILHAQALCDTNQPTVGLPAMLKELDVASARYHEFNPELAHWRARAGLCALSAGNRDQALKLAKQAETALAYAPRLHPYFGRPLQLLQRKLQAARAS